MEFQNHQIEKANHYSSPWRVIPDEMTFPDPRAQYCQEKEREGGKKRNSERKRERDRKRENNKKPKFIHIYFIVPKVLLPVNFSRLLVPCSRLGVSEHFFCKGKDCKYFRLCKPFFVAYSSVFFVQPLKTKPGYHQI